MLPSDHLWDPSSINDILETSTVSNNIEVGDYLYNYILQINAS